MYGSGTITMAIDHFLIGMHDLQTAMILQVYVSKNPTYHSYS